MPLLNEKILMKISPRQKEEFRKYVAERSDEFTGISEFLRMAAEHYMRRPCMSCPIPDKIHVKKVLSQTKKGYKIDLFPMIDK
jgi:hypothetical protein